jgi:hypothetical protein
MIDWRDSFIDSFAKFMKRDYREDQRRLNSRLARVNSTSAGFIPDLPPIPFNSNPLTVEENACIAVLGINPKYNDKMPQQYETLRRATKHLREGGKKEAIEWLQVRSDYYADGSTDYYKTYFNRIGNHIDKAWKVGPARNTKDARSLFRSRIFKSDVLPWFSVDTKDIDQNKLSAAEADDCALKEFRALLGSAIAAAKPRWIQVNGLQLRDTMSAFFDCDFAELSKFERGHSHTALAGWTTLNGSAPRTPVLLHGFLSSASGPQSPEAFFKIARTFETFVQEPERFVFI